MTEMDGPARKRQLPVIVLSIVAVGTLGFGAVIADAFHEYEVGPCRVQKVWDAWVRDAEGWGQHREVYAATSCGVLNVASHPSSGQSTDDLAGQLERRASYVFTVRGHAVHWLSMRPTIHRARPAR